MFRTALFTTSLSLGCIVLPYTSAAQGANPHDLCATAAYEAEKILKIPAYLLQAIALTESGHWDKVDKKRKPWPWAVGAQKKGHYFATKKEAVDFVSKLQQQGVTNIDIGCMQINLHYHGETFQNLDEGFNPINNVAYAGIFLTELHKVRKSWNQAVKYYHSANPKYNKRYIKAVFESWKKLKEQADKTKEPVQIGVIVKQDTPPPLIIEEEDNLLLPEASVNREIQTILQPESVKIKQENTLFKSVIRYDAFARVKAAQRLERKYISSQDSVPPPILMPSDLLDTVTE